MSDTLTRFRLPLPFFILPALLFCLLPFPASAAEPLPVAPEILALIEKTSIQQVHKDAGAVILLKETYVRVDEHRSATRHIRAVVKLLDDKAVSDYSQVSVSFNSFYDEAVLLRARTITGGKITEVFPDAVQIKTAPGSQGTQYTDMRSLTFSLPGLAKGSAFEYEVRIRRKSAIMENQWFERVNLHYLHYGNMPRIDPVYKSRFVLDVPQGEAFVHRTTVMKGHPEVTNRNRRTVYTWEADNLAPIAVESHMPPPFLTMPTVYVSSLQSWTELGKWAASIFNSRTEPGPEVKAAARDIAGGLSTDREKIRAVFYFVEENVKYVAADLNRGGYTPHFAHEVLKNRYGDCKDQAVLVVSLLKAVNIEAYPAFVDSCETRGIHEDVPSPQFPHAIVYVPLKEGPLWLETTAGVASFPSLQAAYQGGLAFVVDGRSIKPVFTPLPKAESNVGRMTMSGTLNGADYEGTLTFQASGAFSDIFKSLLKTATPDQRKDFVAVFLGRHFPSPYQVRDVTVSEVNLPQVPFSAKAKVLLKDAYRAGGSSYSDQLSFIPALNFFTSLKELPQPDYRKGGFWLPFPFVLVGESFLSAQGRNLKPASIPREKTIETPYLSFRTGYTKEGDSVRSRITLSIKKVLIDRESYPEFYKSVQDILLNSQATVSYSDRKRETDQTALEDAVKRKANDLRSVIDLSKEYLARGRYKDARELLEKGVALEPKNGEVRYFLGICLGYLDLYTESRAELDRAKKLGYRP